MSYQDRELAREDLRACLAFAAERERHPIVLPGL
jgi:uncharacterized protein (DUF433 family)